MHQDSCLDGMLIVDQTMAIHLMQPELQSNSVHDTLAAQFQGICAWFGMVALVSICKTRSSCPYKQVSCNNVISGFEREAFVHGLDAVACLKVSQIGDAELWR